MRFTRIVALFLTLAVPCAAYAQQSKKPRPNSRTTVAPKTPPPRQSFSPYPPPMTPEKAFYYFVAMHGFNKVFGAGGTGDVIKIYGETFDANNYNRAMADEFERNRYWERIQGRIVDGVKKVDFSEKFTFVAYATLGEYSFESHSFPLVQFPEYKLSVGGNLDVTVFDAALAVNRNDFKWSIPMSETDASAFVKSRSMAGTVDRNIMVRVTFSAVPPYGFRHGITTRPVFSSFIYSVEAYGDKSLTWKLGVTPKINALGPNTAQEWLSAKLAAQTATKEIGKYRYMPERKPDGKIRNPLSPPPPPLSGMITLTDVGVTSSDEQPDSSTETLPFRFFYSPVKSLWRANSSYYLNPNQKLFRVRWTTYNRQIIFSLDFETEQERDRFFVDLTRALQEWKTKYAPFQFAAGKVTIDQMVRLETIH